MQLNTIGSKTLRSNDKRGKMDTIGGTLGQDSQESILSPEIRSGGNVVGNDTKYEQNHHGILRTDQYTVNTRVVGGQP